MKHFLYSCLAFLVLSCGAQKNTVNTEEASEPAQWLTFSGENKKSKHIVFISGDEEYRSEEALPQLAKIMSKHHGFKCTVLFAQDPKFPGVINANYGKNIPGLEALATADVMVIFTRFRALPDNQMAMIDAYLKSGKPVMGIRTATHAFNFKKEDISAFKHYSNGYNGDKTAWKGGFGRLVLGEKWISHHGHHKHQSTTGLLANEANSHEIANGLANGDVWGATDVYGVRLPLIGDAKPVVLGQVTLREGEFNGDDIFYGMKPTDKEPATTNKKGEKLNDPMMPVAWVKSYQLPGGKKGKAFTTTVGAANDMLIEGTRRLLVNGIFWVANQDVPAKANVDLVGEYSPTAYEFRDVSYWANKQLKVSDFK